MLAPKVSSCLPAGSSFTIGGTVEPRQFVLPSRSRSTPLVLPHFLPSGSLPQPSSRRYGVCWARTGIAATAASTAASSRYAMRMMAPSVGPTIYHLTFSGGASHGFDQTQRVGDRSRRSRGGRRAAGVRASQPGERSGGVVLRERQRPHPLPGGRLRFSAAADSRRRVELDY